jgi:3-isopropylmalate dehydrogenase
MNFSIALLPGDGIGPEVIEAARRVLQAVGHGFGHTFSYSEHLIGGCAIDQTGSPLSEATITACKSANAVLLGAVGGPRWDDPSAPVRPEQGLLRLRKELGVFANLRPVTVHPALVTSSPLRPDKLTDVDILVIRELTGGLYFGQPRGQERVNGKTRAFDTLEYTDYEIRRVMDLAFQLARTRRSKVTSVDKANVLESSRLWRQVAIDTSSNYPDIVLEHVLVDTAAMRLVTNPAAFDVLVTENMFGDILTDEASVLAGSMGMLPSASLGKDGPGLYEPIHGSAPDIAGKGIANPIGAIMSAALMLRHSFKLDCEAVAIERAVNKSISDGCLTVDLGGSLSTVQMTDQIIDCLPGGHFLGL